MYTYSYFVYVGMLALIWLVIFLLRKDLRKQQIIFSIFTAPLAPITQYLWFYHDYWRPEYIYGFNIGKIPTGVEELLFAFFVGGIAGVIYEVVFRKKRNFGKPRHGTTLSLFALGFISSAILIALGVNSIWATSISLIIVATIMISIDRDLIRDAIYTSIFLTIMAIFLYLLWMQLYPGVIQEFWIVSSFSGIEFLGIPLEELAWFFSAGLCGGVFYEFWLNADKYTKKK